MNAYGWQAPSQYIEQRRGDRDLHDEGEQTGDGHWLLESDLVFYDGMDGGVALYARHPDMVPSMVVLDKYQALLLIEACEQGYIQAILGCVKDITGR